MTTRARAVTWLALGLCAAGVLTGFVVTRGADLPAINVRPVVSESQVRLPIESYEATFAEEVLAGRAVTKLADACLTEYRVPAPRVFLGHVASPAPLITASTVQWLSLASAQQYGFNPPQSPASLTFQNIVWANGGLLGLSPAQRQALNGPPVAATGSAATVGGRPLPAGGCLGRAAAEITVNVGSVPALSEPVGAQQKVGAAYFELVWPGLPIQLEQAAVLDAESDPRVLAVAAQWHACMSKAGYSYATPSDAVADPRWAAGTTGAAARVSTHKLQLTVAVADARCQQLVNFAGTRLAVLAGYQDRLINSHASQLRRYEKQVADLVANARVILGGRKP